MGVFYLDCCLFFIYQDEWCLIKICMPILQVGYKLRKAVSEETALEREVIDSHSLSIQRKKDAPLVAYSSPSFSLPKGTTNMNDMQQFVDEIIEKSKKGAPIGTERTWGGKVYIKANQWNYDIYILDFLCSKQFFCFIKNYVINIWIVKID